MMKFIIAVIWWNPKLNYEWLEGQDFPCASSVFEILLSSQTSLHYVDTTMKE